MPPQRPRVRRTAADLAQARADRLAAKVRKEREKLKDQLGDLVTGDTCTPFCYWQNGVADYR
jgi:hypothetical protein